MNDKWGEMKNKCMGMGESGDRELGSPLVNYI